MQQRLTTVWQEFAAMNVHYSYCFSRADQQVYFGENERAGPYGQDFNEFLKRCLKGWGGDKRMVNLVNLEDRVL
jgi:hypothetical protein